MQGFNEEVITILRKRYPADLLATLQSQSYGALRDLCDAFPDDSILANSRLKKFLEVMFSLRCAIKCYCMHSHKTPSQSHISTMAGHA